MKKLLTIVLLLYCGGLLAQSGTCYEDNDHDGYGDPNRPFANTIFGCAWLGGVENKLDCDDNDDDINPNTVWYKDFDNDGYTDGNTLTQCTRPESFYKLVRELKDPNITNIDCNDNDALQHPGAGWIYDPDHDGWITKESRRIASCLSPGADYTPFAWTISTLFGEDCNQNDPLEHPGQRWYADADGDHYISDPTPIINCTRPAGHFAESEVVSLINLDCNDNDPNVNPGAQEICNGIDEDCNGQIDDALTTQIFFRDADSDGYGDPNNSRQGCIAGYVSDNSDCDDNDPVEHPNQHWVPDNDHDKYQPLVFSITQCERPPGYIAITEAKLGIDCNDNDPGTYPGATETCDNADNNCNGQIDEGFTTFSFVIDADGDGYYPGSPIVQCSSPGAGYILLIFVPIISGNEFILVPNKSPGDCDDNNAAINPTLKWVVDADGDGYHPGSPIQQCSSPGAGYILITFVPVISGNGLILVPNKSPGDCDDNAAGIHPNATELCDGVDNDCDGLIDEGVKLTFYQDFDGDGYGNAAISVQACSTPAGYVSNNTDCNDNGLGIHPGATEVCDGVDNDCDGLIDEGVKLTFYRDVDGDGYGNVAISTQACSTPAGYVSNSSDCNDSAPGIHPNATEVCDGADNDCDGLIDEGVKLTFYKDLDGDGYGNAAVSVQACSAPAGHVASNTDCNDTDPTVNPGAVEVCNNNKDDNCNGVQNEAGCYTCGNATTFSTTNVTSNSATLNWVSIPHPNFWQVQYKAPGAKWTDVLPDPAGNQRSVTINGLIPNKNYQWHIKAKCGNGWTSYSVSIPFTTAGGATTRSQTNANAEMEASEVAIGSLQVKASPNPSNTSFRITLSSNNLKEPVKLIITDMLGRVIETRTTNAGQIIIGEKYRSGTYLVRIIQGNESRQLKLIKLPD